jgi:hypothetical protein
MVSIDPISRRAWFRRSLGLHLQPEESPNALLPEAVSDTIALGPATAEQVLDRIAAEPAHRLILPKLLEFCITPHTTSEIKEWLMRFPEMQTAFHPPELLLKWMIQSGGIAPACENPSLEHWRTTEAGREALASNSPFDRLRRLLIEEPAYKEIYRQILEFCVAAKSISEIEGLLRANPVLENPKVYPNYIVDRLETAGGLEWTGQWLATEAGKLFLQS